jgi:adenylate cyclase
VAILRVTGPGRGPLDLELKPAYSILNQLAMAGLPIPHDCGGKAKCGTCRLRVISGAGSLVPRTPGPAEAERLAAVGAGEAERLACQIRSVRDLEVEMPGRETR